MIRTGLAAMAFWMAALMIPGTAAIAQDYLLGVQDRLHLRIVNTDEVKSGAIDYISLSGEYQIRPDGFLSIPLVGDVMAKDRPISALSDDISIRLQRVLGLNTPPHIGLEVVQYRPVYILGFVARAGAQPFFPGMTVEQMVSLSGGISRAAGPGASSPDKVAQMGGDIQIASMRIQSLSAEEARLSQELAAFDQTEPSNVPQTPLPPLQDQIMTSNRIAHDAQAKGLAELKDMLGVQIERLTEQMVLRDRQIAAVRSDLDGVNSLKERGLAVNARVTALTTSLNDLESKRLDLENARLVAQTDLNAASRAQTALADDARTDRLTRLAEIRAEIAATATQLATLQERFALESGMDAPLATGLATTKIEYHVNRHENDKIVPLVLGPTDRLEPGDVLEVKVITPTGGAL